MVLSSQSPRTGHGGSARSRRGTTGRWKAAIVLLVVVVGAYFLFFRGGGDEAGADAGDATGTVTADTRDAESAATGVADAGRDAAASPSGSDVVHRGALARDDSPRITADTSALRTPPRIDAPAEDAASSERDNTRNADLETNVPAAEPTPVVTPPAPRAARPAVTTAGDAGDQLREGLRMIAEGNTVAGRAQLSGLLLGHLDQLSSTDADLIRERLADLNAELVFSPAAVPNDTITSGYLVQPGDLLGSIARRAKVPYPLLEMVNGIQANRMRAGQSIKLINGPVHARILKSGFVMDLYVNGTDGAPVFLASFPVGLGENDNTPPGSWVVARGKVTNPDWRNPRTNAYYPADHPENPIGEYWVPITGTDENTKSRTGFGIHGTIDPDSIGQSRSMGCVRLADADIALVYNMLEPGASTIEIVP